jgi:hypothetical protein
MNFFVHLIARNAGLKVVSLDEYALYRAPGLCGATQSTITWV